MASYRCPDCKYVTPHAHLMDVHRKNTRHGQKKAERKYTTIHTKKGTIVKRIK